MNKFISCVFGVATLLVLSAAPAFAQSENAASEITPASVLSAMQRVADWQLAHPETNRPTGWICAVGDAGMMVLAGISGDAKYRDAMLAKGGQLMQDPGLILLAQHRAAGPAEYHDKTNHVFIMVDGEATFVVGGKEIDPKRTAADQMRAPTLEGGTTYHLTKGDVITIPAKTWHWFKDVPTKMVSYYAVNIDSE